MNQKMFIIKADDYARNGHALDQWRRFFEITIELNCTCSIGVVTNEVSKNPASANYLNSLHLEYGFEVWNHSHSHVDFRKLSKENIFSEIESSQKLLKDSFGIDSRVFGAPFNYIDSASADAIVEMDMFDGYYAFDDLVPSEINIGLKYFINAEIGTDKFRPVRYDVFSEALARREIPDFLVLQVHPFYWSDECFVDFRRIILDLKNHGYQSISSVERFNYNRIKKMNEPISLGKSIAHNIIHEERALSFISDNKEDYRSDSSYYFRVLKDGTSEIYHFLKKLGFNNIPKISDRHVVLDVGAGVGNWSAAAALFPNTDVIALDRELIHLNILLRSQSSNIQVMNSELEDNDLADGGVSAIICNNALNYMSLIGAFDQFFRVASDQSGVLFIGLQNRLYPLADAISAIKRDNYSLAKSYMDRVVNNEAHILGFLEKVSIGYWNSEELSRVGANSGFKLIRRNIYCPGQKSGYKAKNVFSGYQFIKTTASKRFRKSSETSYVGLPPHSINLSSLLDDFVANHNNTKFSMKDFLSYANVRNNYLIDVDRLNLQNSLAIFLGVKLIEKNLPLIDCKNVLVRSFLSLYSALHHNDDNLVRGGLIELEAVIDALSIDDLAFWY